MVRLSLCLIWEIFSVILSMVNTNTHETRREILRHYFANPGNVAEYVLHTNFGRRKKKRVNKQNCRNWGT